MHNDLILGTAGHIDHGKTALIQKLTGTATDRLPEERKRGITIELGYAFLDLPPWKIGVVDVPGHEKFVRQMLAGATGVDMVMLVVAGDDSVKQQTIEHLDILRMLNLSAGVIALTKCDLVESDWLDMVEEEIRGRVKGSFLETAPIVRCSSKTGAGIDELKTAIAACCGQVTENRRRALAAPFRMAIDRCFTIEGHGTVVTGSIASGTLNVGDQLQIEPGEIEVRVRGIQNHDHSAESVHQGQRAAINLAGIHHQKVERGHELAANGYLKPSKMLLVEIRLLPGLKRPLKDRTKVRFHIGTAEILANVRLLEHPELNGGDVGLAQLYLTESAVAVHGQPFILRSESPVLTIGGGRVLHPDPVLLKKPTGTDVGHVSKLTEANPRDRVSAAIYLAASKTSSGSASWTKEDLPRIAGVEDPEEIDQIAAELVKDGTLLSLKLSQSRSLELHRDRLKQVADRVVARLGAMHDHFPLRFTHPRKDLENHFSYLGQPEILAAAIEYLKSEKTINANVNSIGLNGRGPRLSKGQKVLLDWLIQQVKTAGLSGPTVKQLEQAATKNKDSVSELLSMACENGDLVKLEPDGFFLHHTVVDAAIEQLRDEFGNGEGLTISDIGKRIEVSRKYSVPLCEYFDRINLTKRVADKRVLV